MQDTLLVTGGAGFIGSAFVLKTLAESQYSVVNLDLYTYSAHPGNLAVLANHPRFNQIVGNIADRELVKRLLTEHRPRAVINFAAESHVDRSIFDPTSFERTNVHGTLNMLQCSLELWKGLPSEQRRRFRFLQVSTDEVFGSLSRSDEPFTEESSFGPNSPYAASKAAADHFVRAFNRTYELPTLITHCSNNYGPRQFPEKLIPLMIVNALAGRELPIYGDGQNVRDWLYVDDHCDAVLAVLEGGRAGDTYNIGGQCERTNLDLVRSICEVLDDVRPRNDGRAYFEQVAFVSDRLGHDRRYAVNAEKIRRSLGWRASETLETGLRKTVQWYLTNPDWLGEILGGDYKEWVSKNYGTRERLE